MKKSLLFFLCIVGMCLGNSQELDDLRNQKIDGYRGIWFELNQKYPYGDKYSGALGTYTAKHIPLAIYSPEANKTFFVYGGTTQKDQRHLLCMVGSYDHATGLVSRPIVAYDKQTVDDPHDNPTILIDDKGYIWIFVSGRGTSRKGIKLKGSKPFSIDHFNIVEESEFTYPQIWNTNEGFFHFFTKYKFLGVRELFFESYLNKKSWATSKKLASIPSGEDRLGGHYQVSSMFDKGATLGTFFNRHINGNVDTRTDLYYIQTTDYGIKWSTVYGRKIAPPVNMVKSRTRVIDYRAQRKNVYLKDMAFDNNGNPVCLYITSAGHEPGPKSAPYEWRITFWTGKEWVTSIITTSDHNYDMGSIFISENDIWKMVGPTENGPQKYGVGGEIAIWVSNDCGSTWSKEKVMTKNSEYNHSYVRRALHAKAPFSFFWANGDAQKISESQLFFGDFNGDVYRLPYTMKEEWEKPVKVH